MRSRQRVWLEPRLSRRVPCRQHSGCETPTAVQAKNPYGGVPSGGITFPPYYRPTPYLVSNNIYYPGQEPIGPDEMRISFIGSTPIPVTSHRPAPASWSTWQRQEVFLRFRLGLHAQHHRDGGAADFWSTTSSSPISMWITTPTCPICSLSRRGWGAGSRCVCTGRPAARRKTASST